MQFTFVRLTKRAAPRRRGALLSLVWPSRALKTRLLPMDKYLQARERTLEPVEKKALEHLAKDKTSFKVTRTLKLPLPVGAVEGFMMFTELFVKDHEQHLVNQDVRLCGLNAKPELNGKTGRTVCFEAATQRYGVQIQGIGRMAVRPDNLQLNCNKHVVLQPPAKGKKNDAPPADISGASPSSPVPATSTPFVPVPVGEYVSLADQLAQADLLAEAEEVAGFGEADPPLLLDGATPSVSSDVAASASSKRRKKKGKGGSGGGGGGGSSLGGSSAIDAMGAHVEELSLAQTHIKEAYNEFHALQEQLNGLEKLIPNTEKGAQMLWKKKKALMDQMGSKLDRVRDLSRAHEGAGNIATVERLKTELAEQVASAPVVR